MAGNVRIRNETGGTADTVVEVDGVRMKGVRKVEIVIEAGKKPSAIIHCFPEYLDVTTLHEKYVRVMPVEVR